MEDDWTETNDAQFANVSDFGGMKPAFSMLPDDALYSVGDKIFKQPKKEGNDSQSLGQDMTNLNDLESELREPPEDFRNKFW